LVKSYFKSSNYNDGTLAFLFGVGCTLVFDFYCYNIVSFDMI